MATSNPARVLRESSGILREGAEADVVIMDEQIGQVKRTIVGGTESFKA